MLSSFSVNDYFGTTRKSSYYKTLRKQLKTQLKLEAARYCILNGLNLR